MIPSTVRRTFVCLGTMLMLLTATLAVVPGAAAANGGPDAFGYRFRDSVETNGPTYNFVDLSSTGTSTGIQCDDCMTAALPIGFDFNFYGTTYTQLYASSNGFVTFNAGSPNQYNPQNFPNTDVTNVIAGYWEDLDTRPTASDIRYQTFGSAPHRVFIVSFDMVYHYSQTTPIVTFQIKLYEGSDNIQIHYQSAESDGGNHLVGIMNNDKTSYLTYSYGSNSYVEHAVLFTTHRLPDSQSFYPDDNGSLIDAAIRGSCPASSIVTLADGATQYWIATEAALTDVNFGANAWTYSIRLTESSTGTFALSVGSWDGSAFTSAGTSVVTLSSATDYTGTISVSSPFTVQQGKSLAFRLDNTIDSPAQKTNRMSIATGGADCASTHTFFTSPNTDPGYPTPELSSIVLTLGGAGIVGLVALRRRS